MKKKKKKKKKKRKNKEKQKRYFSPVGIRTRNSADQKQVSYPLHNNYRVVITDRTFHLNYSEITLFL